jgi:hypothetical protein
MSQLDKLLKIDVENIETSKRALLSIFPESLILVEHFIDYFNDVFVEFGQESDYDRHQGLISKWAKDFSVSDTEILEFLRSAVLIGENHPNDKSQGAKEAIEEAQTILVRTMLCMRLQRDFMFGLSNILQGKITPAIGYVRIQAETMGIMKLMINNTTLALDWLNSSSANSTFYNDWHGKIKQAIKELNLNFDYNFASGHAIHSRVGGISKGILIGFKDKKPGEIVLSFREFDSPKELFYWFAYFMRVHKKIIDNIKTAIPELKKEDLFNNHFNSLQYLENKVWHIAKKIKDEIKP